MASLADTKNATLVALGFSGTNQEMERDFLIDALGGAAPYTTMSINELWHAYLDDQLVAAGHLSDRQAAYFSGLGYSGTLTEQTLLFWEGLYPS